MSPLGALRPWLVSADRDLTDRAHARLLTHDAFVSARPGFARRLPALDRHLFGPSRRALPAWVLYDCALAPGAVVGLGAEQDALGPAALEAYGDDLGEGLHPVSFAMVIPTAEPGVPLMHSLAAAPALLAEPPSEGGLLSATLELATAVLGLSTFLATAPWASPLPSLFAGSGVVEILAARCPTHDEPATAVLRVGAGAVSSAAPSALDPSTEAGQEGIQLALEAGRRAFLEARLGQDLLVRLTPEPPR